MKHGKTKESRKKEFVKNKKKKSENGELDFVIKVGV